jgi:ketosteroid isomerase-like protein
MQCDAFRKAVEALDLEATLATLAPTIVLRSPVRDEPLRGKEAVRPLFAILLQTFKELRFLESFTSTMVASYSIFNGASENAKSKAST